MRVVQDLDSCSDLWGFRVSLEQGFMLLIFVGPNGMIFKFSGGWKIKKVIFYDMGKLSEIHILVFINIVLLEHCHTHLGIVCNCLYISLESWIIASLCGIPHSSGSKESACNAGDPGLIPGSERSSGEGNGNPLQYSYLESPMDRGSWKASVHGVARVRHDWATKPPHGPQSIKFNIQLLSKNICWSLV